MVQDGTRWTVWARLIIPGSWVRYPPAPHDLPRVSDVSAPAAVLAVRTAHQPVKGRSERGKPYSASYPEMAACVHNVLTESFLVAFQTFGPQPLTRGEADRFVQEQMRIGALLGASPLPSSAEELSHWVFHHAALAGHAITDRAIAD